MKGKYEDKTAEAWSEVAEPDPRLRGLKVVLALCVLATLIVVAEPDPRLRGLKEISGFARHAVGAEGRRTRSQIEGIERHCVAMCRVRQYVVSVTLEDAGRLQLTLS